VVAVSAIVNDTPADIAETLGIVVVSGATHVGVDGKFDAKVNHVNMIRLAAVTAVVLTVYVAVAVGITTAPAAADPQAAGETELTAQLDAVLYAFPLTDVDAVKVVPAIAVAVKPALSTTPLAVFNINVVLPPCNSMLVDSVMVPTPGVAAS
jgi:hypothetical protein